MMWHMTWKPTTKTTIFRLHIPHIHAFIRFTHKRISSITTATKQTNNKGLYNILLSFFYSFHFPIFIYSSFTFFRYSLVSFHLTYSSLFLCWFHLKQSQSDDWHHSNGRQPKRQEAEENKKNHAKRKPLGKLSQSLHTANDFLPSLTVTWHQVKVIFIDFHQISHPYITSVSKDHTNPVRLIVDKFFLF